MNTISFNSANFVARELGYHMPGGWGEGELATINWFKPISTFGDRFDTMLQEITALGFNAVDLWAAQLHFNWATPEHIDIAKSLLAKHGLRVTSYGGGAGTITDLRAICRLCVELNTPFIGGISPVLETDRQAAVHTLREFGMVLCYENHPEKSANEILAKIGNTDVDVIGVAADTGWFGSQKFDAPTALRELASRLRVVHLKDVKARRDTKTGFGLIDMGHETCKYGDGIVNIQECVNTLVAIGYKGPISLEHEPEDYDPREEVAASKVLLEGWLADAQK